jgi:hypothetical protein
MKVSKSIRDNYHFYMMLRLVEIKQNSSIQSGEIVPDNIRVIIPNIYKEHEK